MKKTNFRIEFFDFDYSLGNHFWAILLFLLSTGVLISDWMKQTIFSHFLAGISAAITLLSEEGIDLFDKDMRISVIQCFLDQSQIFLGNFVWSDQEKNPQNF